jgi:hypothetical protein
MVGRTAHRRGKSRFLATKDDGAQGLAPHHPQIGENRGLFVLTCSRLTRADEVEYIYLVQIY